MKLLAEIPDRVVAVPLSVIPVQNREHFGERRVRVQEPLEMRDPVHEVLHLREIFRRGHEEEDRIQVRLLRHDAVLTQVLSEDPGRHAERLILPALDIDAGGREEELARIHEVLIGAVILKAVPLRARLILEEPEIPCDLLSRIAVPGLSVHLGRNKRADIAAGLQEILSRLDPDLHAVIPEQTPGRAGMHLSVDVKRREKRIERAGRRVHHEG